MPCFAARRNLRADDGHRGPLPPPDCWLAGCAAVLGPWLPGPVLDVGCGFGQNALWLAQRGLTVEGIDVSDSAVAQANEAAARLGRPARFRRFDVSNPPQLPAPPRFGWGGIVVLRFLDRALLPLIAASVAPGGIIAYKTHLAHPLRGVDTRPRNPSFLLRPGELLNAFPGFSPLDYVERVGPGESFAALLARRYSR